MTRRWRKHGRVYVPDARRPHPKLRSHAANPLPVHLEGDVYRVFYSGRDQHNRSSVGAVDISVSTGRVEAEHAEPVFEHGPAGSFFADGVSIANCYTVGQTRYMLFMGWQAPADAHWRGDIGRLCLDADLGLRLDSDAPLLGVDPVDPISLSYPWVLPRPGGGYDMWYGSTRSWDAGNGEMLHTLHHAHSKDGHHWTRTGLAVPYTLGTAQAFSRPTVVPGESGGLDMWFSYRSGAGEAYRIGYAHSADGTHWVLALDEAGITVSDSGWDAEMVAYPYVFDHGDTRLMLYNGNGYGKSGFGLAVLDD
ncbi:MAG: hypothetical protein AAGA11_06710 [Pseudomonadota bacterium]